MRVELGIRLEMAKPVVEESLSSGNVVLEFENGRKLTLDFFLTSTNTSGNVYEVCLEDMNSEWPDYDETFEEGIENFEPSDFANVKGVRELYLYGSDDAPYVEGQAILHASATLCDVDSGETLCSLSDKEFANTDFGEFYPNEIGKALKEVA